MAAAAHNPAFAKKAGIPQSVAQEFNQADKGKKFGRGGMATNKLKGLFKGKESYAEELKEAKAIKSGKITPQEYAKGEKMEGHKMGGRIASKGEHSVQKQSKRGAEMVKMKKGGRCYDEGGEVEFETKTGKNEAIGDDVRARAMKAIAEGGVKEAAKAKPRMKAKAKSNVMTDSMSRMNPMGDTYKRGGSVSGASKRADGCAMKGKTKGRMI